MLGFTIHAKPVTKKNSQRLIIVKGRPRIIPSDAYRRYERECARYMPYVDEPISEPVNVKATFYMATRHKVDLVNLQEALLDVLVKYGVIEDDNSKIVVSMDGSRVGYDKDDPRTEVKIERTSYA